ncbi:MAG: hypothetical protein WA996_14920 [Candidatus Promineifilaceae bacterium]
MQWKRPPSLYPFLFLFPFVLIACGRIEVGVESQTPKILTPLDRAQSTALPEDVQASPTVLATSGATADLLEITPNLEESSSTGAQLTRSIYFLANPAISSANQRRVWRLDPGASLLEPVTEAYLEVTSFDVWPVDGRLVFGTSNGLMVMQLPGEEPERLYDASRQAGDNMEVGSVAWSPDGSSIAFSLQYQDWAATGDLDGLWSVAVDDPRPQKLISNSRPDLDQTVDVTKFRTFSTPHWSPDGSAMLLRASYWEHFDTLWLDPIRPNYAFADIYDSEGIWTSGSWAADSRSILMSGSIYSQYSDLLRIDRQTGQVQLLLDGESAGLFIYGAQELPTGIAFLATDPSQETGLFIVNHLDETFSYAPAGSGEKLCNGGYVREIEWDPSGQLALLSCQTGAQIVSVDGIVDIDLSSFMTPITELDGTRALWGATG